VALLEILALEPDPQVAAVSLEVPAHGEAVVLVVLDALMHGAFGHQ
jgi:hypothetical protein